MKPLCRFLVPLLWAAQAQAQPGTEPQRCQAERGVELIVGGRAAQPCEAAWAAPTFRPAAERAGASRTDRRAAPSERSSETKLAPDALQVSATEQRQRDQDRRAILAQELAEEQLRMAALLQRKGDAEADALQRSRSNLLALQRELERTERR